MNPERAMMQQEMAGLKEKKQRLALRAESMCQSMRMHLNTALTPVEEIDVPQAAQMMDELIMVSAELTHVNGKIARLEKELN